MKFRVKWKGYHPKKKWIYFKGIFEKRRTAKNWIRNNGAGKENIQIEEVLGDTKMKKGDNYEI